MANLRLRLADLNVTLDIGREHSVFLGRDKALVTSIKVSRRQCCLQNVPNASGQPTLRLHANKRVFVKRAGSQEHQTLNTGEDTELHKGDHLYLLREVCPAGGFKYQYDFVVESAYPQAQVEAPPFKKQRVGAGPAELATQHSVQHQLLTSPSRGASLDSGRITGATDASRSPPANRTVPQPATPCTASARAVGVASRDAVSLEHSPPSVQQRRPAPAGAKQSSQQSPSPQSLHSVLDVPAVHQAGSGGQHHEATAGPAAPAAAPAADQAHPGAVGSNPDADVAPVDGVARADGAKLAVRDAATPKPPGPLFAGCRVVFWVTKHVSRLLAKAKENGAVIEKELSAATTHVIAQRDTSPEFVLEKLAKMPKRKCRKVLFHGKRLDLPVGVNFVVPEWVSECIANAEVFTSNRFQIDMQRIAISEGIRLKDTQDPSSVSGRPKYAEPSPDKSASVGVGDKRGVQQAGQPSDTPMRSSDPDRAAVAVNSQSSGQHPLSAGSTGQAPGMLAGKQHAAHPTDGAQASQSAAAGAAAGAVDQTKQSPAAYLPPADPPVCSLQEQKQLERQSALDAEQGLLPRFSGATSGVEWGFNGRWEEPWNEADAKETLRKLERFWYRQGTAKEAAEGDVDTDGPDAAQDLELQASERLHGSASQGPVNTVCTHVACSQQKICLIAELDVIKKNYRGPDKQFKQKAIDRAISAVNAQNKPLVFGSDVDDFDIGEGAKVKLAALINKGSFDRAEAAKGNEHRRVVDQFMAVWGAAEATAERWYNDGARTLDDVRKRTDLTEQQTVGLKYFDDLQHLIPRVEAVKVEQLVYTTACKLLGCDPEAESDRIHCRGMGSYLRGKPATGDIDFLIMPPASAGEVAPGPLLQSLLTSLLRKGLLLNELSPGRPRSVHDRSATWLGLCKPAGSQYVRRIDIKVYKRSALAYAVNYFSGSGSFVRALRFWARASKECAARAAAVVPAANGFKLSDVALVPVLKTRERNAADRQDKNTEVIVGPNQECSCETDIFRMLGLAYVPPSMRFFGAQFE